MVGGQEGVSVRGSFETEVCSTSSQGGGERSLVDVDVDVDYYEADGSRRSLLHGRADGSFRRSPSWGVTLNAIVYMFAGMSMPATMATSGFTAGTLMLLYSFVSTYHSGELIGALCEKFPEANSYPKLLGLSVKKGMQKFSSKQAKRYSELAVLGCIVLQFLAYYFDTIAQLLYVSQYFDQLVPNSNICQWLWLIITFFLVLPLLLVPGFSESRWIAVPTFLGIVMMVVIFVMEIVVTEPYKCNPGPHYDMPSSYSILLSLSAFAYMFGGHGMFPEMIREMKKPKDFSSVLKWTYAFIMASYIICGYLGYWAYGSSVNANINLSWPENAMNIISISIQLIVCYYCVYLTNAVLLLNIEIGVGLLPSSRKKAIRVKRFVFRVLFLALQTIVGLLLLGGSGDIILGLQALSGAIGMSALTYFLPFLMYWFCFPHEMTRKKIAWFSLNIIVGVIIMIGGVMSSVTDILENSGGILNGYCHLEYRYSPSNPQDPCFISGYNRTHLFESLN